MTLHDKTQKLICHCFGYTAAHIECDAIRHGRSLIVEKITAAKQGGECDCREKNPKGR